MSAGRVLGAVTTVLTLIFAVYYQLLLKEILAHAGLWRTAEALNNQRCITIPELQACGKLILHNPSGIVYLVCSTPFNRSAWLPSPGQSNASAGLPTYYIATYDPATSRITRLKITGHPSPVPPAFHSFDVVPSDENPAEIFVYLVNHRLQKSDPETYRIHNVIEIFKAKIGGEDLSYVATIEDPTVMVSPIDVIGYGDGRSFHFTNDHRSRQGFMKTVDFYFRLSGKSVGYCHVDHGCKFAATGLRGANGIARDEDGTYFVTNSQFGEIFVMEKQDEATLVLTDVLKTDRPMTSISVDEAGMLFIAALPNTLQWLKETSNDYIIPSSSSVLRLSRNTGAGQFYGEKYIIDKVFEDNGDIASATTSAIWDNKRNTMYLSGLSSLHVSICEMDNI